MAGSALAAAAAICGARGVEVVFSNVESCLVVVVVVATAICHEVRAIGEV